MCSLLTAAVNRCLVIKNTTEAARVYVDGKDEGGDGASMFEDESDEVRGAPAISRLHLTTLRLGFGEQCRDELHRRRRS